jgi:hypothetical protein
MHNSHTTYVLHVSPITFSSIIFNMYWGTNNEALYDVLFASTQILIHKMNKDGREYKITSNAWVFRCQTDRQTDRQSAVLCICLFQNQFFSPNATTCPLWTSWSTSGSPQLSLSLRFPHQNPVHTSPLPHTRYMSCPSHSSLFIPRTIFGEQYRSLSSSLCSFLHKTK